MGSIFSCVEEFDVVMCGSRFDKVGIYVDIMYSFYDILEFLWGLIGYVCILDVNDCFVYW